MTKKNKQPKAKAEVTEQATPEVKVSRSVISPERKRAYGKMQNNGDQVAAELATESLEAVAERWGIDLSAYSHLNRGMQRMNVGNRIRAMRRHAAEAAALASVEQQLAA